MSDANNSSRHSEKACRLTNITHSDVAPSVPLASLPLFCGALDRELRLYDEHRSLDRPEILANARKIADILTATDVSYLTLRNDAIPVAQTCTNALSLHEEVLTYNSNAFEYNVPGFRGEQIHHDSVCVEECPKEIVPLTGQTRRSVDKGDAANFEVIPASTHSRKFKVSKKEGDAFVFRKELKGQDLHELQDNTLKGFCEMAEDFCARAEGANDELGEMEGLSIHLSDIKLLINEIMSACAKKILHLVPGDILGRLLNILDHQIRLGQLLTVDENEDYDSDVVSLVMCALESAHAALAILTNKDMPKQLYKEEMIERIIDCSRHHVMETMLACDPSYRALHKPRETAMSDDDEDELVDETGSSSKKRRSFRNARMKKSVGNKMSAAVSVILHKLCTILGLLKDLLAKERLPDGCILQLVKTSFTTFIVDNVHILQLKAINLICGVFASYTQHKNFLIDELFHLLWKLPFSKKAIRAYHLPDEEQREIQMISALFIQMVQSCLELPETLDHVLVGNPISESTVSVSYPAKYHDAATEVCCLFWTRVVQRFANAKNLNQEMSELKLIMENLVVDLLTTLNLPEYPASALILEVLCVLLLQNVGLKSKDISARCMAVDILGIIAARLKNDAILCGRERFWILQGLCAESTSSPTSSQKSVCAICFEEGSEKHLTFCQDCEKRFHTDCAGFLSKEDIPHSWLCQLCACKKQLTVLRSYSKSLLNDGGKNIQECDSGGSDGLSRLEIVQQMLLNYLQGAGSSDDTYVFGSWFYICQWHKDDSKSQDNFIYYLAKLKSRAFMRDLGAGSSMLKRDSAKKISLALGQRNSFCRGYEKILFVLLASLRENSPVLRAKALRAVSLIVEADPEALCEKHVQLAVEGRFCDSAISVREAALELVGRHIASHPDVGLKYFEKVAERIKDTGVSVRKRAIKIVRDMCLWHPDFSEFTNACVEIISRVNDEEGSIQDLVCKTFFEFWFEEPPGHQIHFIRDDSPVPLEIARKADQVVEMLRQMPNHQPLINVIRRNLCLDFVSQSAKAVGINAVAVASVRRRCETMCMCLLERILQVEEATTEELEVRALPYVLALHAFCIVDPMLCAPVSDPSKFVVTLQPYLKSQVDSRSVAQLLESIIFVINAVLPLRRPPQGVVEELEQDLKYMIFRHSFLTVVHACIRCLCSLSKIAGKGPSVLESLIQVFFKHLDSLRVDNKQQVGRSLFCLGLLIRYGHDLMILNGGKDVHVVRCVCLLKNYIDMDEFGIKLRALQALGSILIARPEFMLEKDIGNIVETSLAASSESLLKIQELQNLYDYLLDAESKMEMEHAVNNGSTCSDAPVHGVPVAAGAGDTNICGGIIQLYWNTILERCMDVDEQVRQSALKIVEVVLRQGLVHPITSVPYLIALEIDPQEATSKLAHHLLMNMNEKYPSFFESRLGDGLQMSFAFIQPFLRQNKFSGSSKARYEGNIFGYAKIGISRIYRLIRGNRISRNKFMSSVVRKFDSGCCHKSGIPFLIYCSEILASLPFTVPDEPLYLLYAINRVIQVRAGTLEAELKSFAQCLQGETQVSCNYGVGEHDFSADHVTVKADHANGFASNGSGCMHADELFKFQAKCHAAIALQLLLKLKRHLKIVYSLSDARCQMYSPNEPPRCGETLSKQNFPFCIDEKLVSVPSRYEEITTKYQELKGSLQEDALDYATYTSCIKRKRHAFRSGRSMQETSEDEDNEDGERRRPGFKSRKLGQELGGDGDDKEVEDINDEDWDGGSKKRGSGYGRRGHTARGRQRA